MKWSKQRKAASPRSPSLGNMNSVYKSFKQRCREATRTPFKNCTFQILEGSFGEPRLKRVGRTVTKCKGNFEWVVCAVNNVPRQSVKIHMGIPLIFFFPPFGAFDPAVSVMEPFAWVLVGSFSPDGTLWPRRGDNKCWGLLMGFISPQRSIRKWKQWELWQNYLLSKLWCFCVTVAFPSHTSADVC